MPASANAADSWTMPECAADSSWTSEAYRYSFTRNGVQQEITLGYSGSGAIGVGASIGDDRISMPDGYSSQPLSCTATDGRKIGKIDVSGQTYKFVPTAEGSLLFQWDGDSSTSLGFVLNGFTNYDNEVRNDSDSTMGITTGKYTFYAQSGNGVVGPGLHPATIGGISLKLNSGQQQGLFKIGFLRTGVERRVILNANGGKFADGSDSQNRIMDMSNPANLNGLPTQDGYNLSNWNTTADGSGTNAAILGFKGSSNGQTFYAQWEKTRGQPVKTRIDCNTKVCAISASYVDAPSITRTLTAGGKTLAWTDNGIQGVRLDDKGHDAHQSCPEGLTSCYFVSLEQAPPAYNGYVAQNAQTGDPAATVWQRVSYLLAVIAIGTAIGVGLMRRKRSL